MSCKLALEDGSIFSGRAVGAPGTRTGEVVFNTAMTGYQEIFSDPSYCGQIVTMTFPLIGNYGINPDDFESCRPHLAGVVVKELPRRPSNYRATLPLPAFLEQHGILGLANVDTRALTRRIRIHGALRGVISTEILDDLELVRRAQAAASMAGANLVPQVASKQIGEWCRPLLRLDGCAAGTTLGSVDIPASAKVGMWGSGKAAAAAPFPPPSLPTSPPRPPCHIVALDCGIKHNILRHLAEYGCRVTIAPAGASAAQIRELKPDGLLAGNGPGDPAAVTDLIATLRELLGEFPMFGICLGHQLLALALGAETYKLRFGHHGANMPVINKISGRVEITSQNHGFAVDAASLERTGGTVTHVNLNDGSLEGYIHHDHRLVCVQFHPEASPGPHDAGYIFRRFAEAAAEQRAIESVLLS
ncbi:MAG: glutamine-hydrolyzing carbamoyl-phosphate synthase small subunit [Planctomycetota bacterium]